MRFSIGRTSAAGPNPTAGARRGENEHGVPIWLIDIDNLEDLMLLAASEGSLIITSKHSPEIAFSPSEAHPSIEIYDERRES